MNFNASDFYTYYQPSLCELRVYLKHKGEPEGKPNPYLEVLKRLGLRHEQNHLKSFREVLNLAPGSDREKRTLEAIRNKVPVIYQPRFKTTYSYNGIDLEVIGEPDFLIYSPSGYIIRDSKMVRQFGEESHFEIILQLQLYGWLYERVMKERPSRLEVHTGTDEIIEIPYEHGIPVIEQLNLLIDLMQSPSEPYSPVGWTKCGGCVYNERCWSKALADHDMAAVIGVDKGLALSLKAKDIHTYDALLSHFNETTLADFKRQSGKKLKRVGKGSTRILQNAQAMQSGKDFVFKLPAIPPHANYVMFDLEGMPPQLEELDKIYIWGLQVYGETPQDYQPALAEFGEEGDRTGWEDFLLQANRIFREYGDIPFVHWSNYEKLYLDKYIYRYGDPEGVAYRVTRNLVDLLPIARESIALPLPSYSLKVIEKYIGFKRNQEEYGGQWSMAKYIEATELQDPHERKSVMAEILLYNKEDLASMWAILEWLKAKRLS